MNRLISTLAVATALAAPPDTCQMVGTTLADGTDIRGEMNKEYYLVALLYAW